ncbi:MAG: hypothetical protein HOP12_14860 [Candidatus Eisenbacteria bacterium]|uniref:Uncharacterized protein n=1 Tax=Eiseniibacteriota bacterium TaxID=2212470 RepID=A0A849SNP3_UNCEI|nr:hypothetical protein [Candidatus Eisenbacteria bacterium]
MAESSESEVVAGAGEHCAQCGKSLTPTDRVAAGDRVFCRSCYANLRAELEQAVGEMSSEINYVNGTVGAILGGAVGALVWWAFTVLTNISFGLIAVGIGFAVGWGVVKFSGGKRSHGLQAISIVVALASYCAATYFVNMTFINRALEKQGEAMRIGFPPQSFELFGRVLSSDLGLMDLVFVAIVVYQAWSIPKPVALPPSLTT